MYTPGFAPPELYSKAVTLGPWSDIYSIGASMYACMCGAPPQPANERGQQDKMGEQFDKLAPHYSEDLVRMVRWCLELDPEKRPQSLFALQKQLNAPPPEPPADGMLQKFTRALGRFGGVGGRKAE
jgi:serine/threonine protein kinase